MRIFRSYFRVNGQTVFVQHNYTWIHVAKAVIANLQSLKWKILSHSRLADAEYHLYWSIIHVSIVSWKNTKYNRYVDYFNNRHFFQRRIRRLPGRCKKIVANIINVKLTSNTKTSSRIAETLSFNAIIHHFINKAIMRLLSRFILFLSASS